jgi:methylthioribose-1-phosphate isomerase
MFGSQGGRLTAWECEKMGVPYTLICDNMAASLMRDGKVFPPVAPPASRCPCRTSHGA